jgi:hypothetical protein
MRPGALAFMLGAWTLVLTLLVWSFARLLRQEPPRPEDEA